MLFDQDDRPIADDHLLDEPPPRRVARWLVVLGILVVVSLMVLAVGGVWVKGKIDPAGPPGEEVALDIPLGTSTSGIADRLAEAGIITSAEVFRWYLRINGGGPFKAGLFYLQRNSAMGDVVKLLEKGPALPPAVNVTVPEGLWVREVADRVDRVDHLSGARFLELAKDGTVRSQFQPEGASTLEGLLFPETYRVELREDEEAVLRRMVEVFDTVASDLGYAEAPSRVGVSPYEAIIVASLVEAEAKVDDDRAKIARVIYNRLEQGIPLGIDATFYFALNRRGGSLRQSELEIDSDYNTRKVAGLVPTPVAMPGRASLEAAMNPEAGPWLYYVLADEDGHHAFTDDYNQFLRDKRRAQENGLIP